MTEPLSQRDLLIRYLLGVASEQERTAVEEQYFADDTGLEVLVRAEDELIDDYVRGVLSESDQQLFEDHFLCTEARRERLQSVKSFVKTLAQTKSILPEVIKSSQRRAPSRQAITLHQLAPEPALTGLELLLKWLDPDVKKAGEKYEAIRRRLVKFFGVRGVDNPEALADETIYRVASRSSALLQNYVGSPEAYFYRVAHHLMREATRSHARPFVSAPLGDEGVSDQTYACLEKCLEHLSASDRELILEFYAVDRRKPDSRKELAQRLGISLNALRVRAFRLRQGLEKCINSCLQEARDTVDDR